MEASFAALALTFCTLYLVIGTQIELRMEAAPGQIDARFWPTVLGVTGLSVSVALLAISIAKPAASREDLERIRPGGISRVFMTGLLTLGMVSLWSITVVEIFGSRIDIFPIITALYMFLLLILYGLRNWIGLIIYPLAVTAFIYVLFGILLRIPL
jgi:hypothetical protein